MNCLFIIYLLCNILLFHIISTNWYNMDNPKKDLEDFEELEKIDEAIKRKILKIRQYKDFINREYLVSINNFNSLRETLNIL